MKTNPTASMRIKRMLQDTQSWTKMILLLLWIEVNATLAVLRSSQMTLMSDDTHVICLPKAGLNKAATIVNTIAKSIPAT